jgi:hypothetical protein
LHASRTKQIFAEVLESAPKVGNIFSMPTYTFELRDGSSGIYDEIGILLPDREHALQYAHDVARELMSCCEVQTRFWRLDVYEDNATRVFEIPFATVDRTLDHLAPELRMMMEQLCERHRALSEATHAAHITMRESRALVALSRGKPYLVTYAGERTIGGSKSVSRPG